MEGRADRRRRARRPPQPGRICVERNAEDRWTTNLGRIGTTHHRQIPLVSSTSVTTLFPMNRPHQARHPLFYRRLLMATSTRTTGRATPATTANYERERVFGLFRQFGYLEAELNPLGLLPPQPHPDLKIDNEWAREARRIYCG